MTINTFKKDLKKFLENDFLLNRYLSITIKDNCVYVAYNENVLTFSINPSVIYWWSNGCILGTSAGRIDKYISQYNENHI